ncbi:zinc finger protein 805-like isoform X2 [Neophocaena asiaeorientalis asiaeorientalis]|uniref:Zinc finger protein 805-like isoform X2 n=1 Tax=Neophocaena asiaeorientalis asiaeorientalis TaxID=1706337 RepID=A0A341B7C9_NEOAA|nr:zinc finger protein 805-like isoform X2 [Neophocaena asiaeorientalis asiaeorientalis]
MRLCDLGECQLSPLDPPVSGALTWPYAPRGAIAALVTPAQVVATFKNVAVTKRSGGNLTWTRGLYQEVMLETCELLFSLGYQS